jgi:hypothetical protein
LIPIPTSPELIRVGAGEAFNGAYDINSIPNQMHDLAAGRNSGNERNPHGIDGRLLDQT